MRVDARRMTFHECLSWEAYRGTVTSDRKILMMVWADDVTHEWGKIVNDYDVETIRARRIIINASTRIIIVDPDELTDEQDQDLADAVAGFKGKVHEWLKSPECV